MSSAHANVMYRSFCHSIWITTISEFFYIECLFPILLKKTLVSVFFGHPVCHVLCDKSTLSYPVTCFLFQQFRDVERFAQFPLVYRQWGARWLFCSSLLEAYPVVFIIIHTRLPFCYYLIAILLMNCPICRGLKLVHDLVMTQYGHWPVLQRTISPWSLLDTARFSLHCLY